MESPCVKCDEYNMPHCMSKCQKLENFQTILFQKEKGFTVKYNSTDSFESHQININHHTFIF